MRRGIARDFARVEGGECAAIGGAFAQDRRPAQACLRALENEELEQAALVRDGHAPFAVVIAHVERRARPRASTNGAGTRADRSGA